ncbi:MAG: nicotinate (nicotinamide) nucleotide adenylyltransferase [Acholeplasmataceae bacterium]|nr:nicotinate (nicotinamide) nucleotide adenylyltransferase [Acholeplasmataceae bacterium]
MMTIIYGGTFNPPTIAHYLIAKHLITKFPNSKLIFLPTSSFYAKGAKEAFHHRYAMLEIMAKKLGPNVSVSDFENQQKQYLGTYHTLKHFSGAYFVLGADNLLTISSWIKYPDVVIENKFIVFPRDHINLEKVFSENEILNKYRDNFIIIDDFDQIDISSSLYRKAKSKEYLLPEVQQYIEKNNLYKEEH